MSVVGKYFKRVARGQAFALNVARREVLPSWLTWTTSDKSGALTIPASGVPAQLVGMKQPYSSAGGLDDNLGTPFEVRYLVMTTDAAIDAPACSVNFTELGEARRFMNRPIRLSTIFGNSKLPGVMPEPYFLFSQHEIQAQFFANTTGAPVNIRAFFGGAQFFPWSPALLGTPVQRTDLQNTIKKWKERKKYVLPFWMTPEPVYPADTVDVNSGSGVLLGANQQKQIFATVGEDGHFEAVSLQANSTGEFSMTLFDTKTRQTLMNGTITNTNSMGTAQYPTVFPTSFLFPAGRKLLFTLTDLSGATNSVFVTLSGKKIYNAPFKDVGDVLRDTKVENQW